MNKLIILDNDVEIEVEVLDLLDLNEKKYIVYTKGEKDEKGDNVVYISILNFVNEQYEIEEIGSDEEYKDVVKKLSEAIVEA